MSLLLSVLSNLKFSQPFRKFLNELLVFLLIVPGQATLRNRSRYSAYDEKTFCRWYRWEVDWAGVKVAAIRAVVPGRMRRCSHLIRATWPRVANERKGRGFSGMAVPNAQNGV